MMKNVKIIGIDLDDTLLHDDLTISDYTVSVLQALMKKGVFIVLASGRSPRAIFPYMQRIGADRADSYMLSSNGSQILSADMKKQLSGHCLDIEAALKIYDFIEEHDLSCHLYVDDTIYAAKQTIFSEKDSHLSKLKLVIPKNYRQVLKTVPVYKMVVPAMPDIISAFEPEFKRRFGKEAVIFTSKPYFLELIPLHTGKGEALLELAGRLEIAQQAVMAFGDSMNDETMIRCAGYGIAMKNGLPRIQEIADAVTDFTNNEDGVARFLEKYVL
ncbi:MAG: Cof-type HAD-IIB family hydrolase [Treponema sp.]